MFVKPQPAIHSGAIHHPHSIPPHPRRSKWSGMGDFENCQLDWKTEYLLFIPISRWARILPALYSGRNGLSSFLYRRRDSLSHHCTSRTRANPGTLHAKYTIEQAKQRVMIPFFEANEAIRVISIQSRTFHLQENHRASTDELIAGS